MCTCNLEELEEGVFADGHHGTCPVILHVLMFVLCSQALRVRKKERKKNNGPCTCEMKGGLLEELTVTHCPVKPCVNVFMLCPQALGTGKCEKEERKKKAGGTYLFVPALPSQQHGALSSHVHATSKHLRQL